MVFSSVPVYLDPPNWQQQQQQNQQQQGGRGGENPQLLSSPLPPTTGGGGGGGGDGSPSSIRPGSMSDRARLAKLPQPETALKCPRCESTNTKFCYFNNYSLTQPRHFCKTCRRYWTRGGALRSVPVGGGCRRNKRSKGSGSSSRSKSPAADHHQHQAAAGSSSSTVSSNSCSTTDNIMGRHLGHQLPHQLPFLPSLHHLSEYGNSGDMGLNFGGNQLPQVVANGGGSGGGVDVEFHHHHGIGGLGEHWRSLLQHQVQQFPNFLSNLEPPITHGLYPFDHHQGDQNVNEPPISYGRGTSGQLPISKPTLDSTSTEGTVKMEDQNQALNMSRNFLGSLGNDHHHQYWDAGSGGISAAWTDLSAGFTSSTSHLL